MQPPQLQPHPFPSWLDQSSITSSSPPYSCLSSQQLLHKYQQCLKQCSQYRIQIRELKQEKEWIQNMNLGIINQCQVLKELLAEKKEMLVEVNGELRDANGEICRLEDQVGERVGDCERVEGELEKCREELENTTKQLQQLQYQHKSQTQTLLTLTSDYNNLQHQLLQSKKTQHTQQTSSLQQIHTKICQILTTISTEGDGEGKAKGDRDGRGKGKARERERERDGESIVKELVGKVEKIVEGVKEERENWGKKVEDMREQIQGYVGRIGVLEEQLREAGELVQEAQAENTKNYKTINQLQQKLHQTQHSTKKTLQTWLQTSQKYHSIYLSLLSPFLQHQQPLLQKLQSLITQSPRNPQISSSSLQDQHQLQLELELELELVLQEIKSVLDGQIGYQNQVVRLRKELREKDGVAVGVEGQFETLKIKYLCLQREYQAVVDDNRRILKFNQISRYRADRNLGGEARNRRSNQKVERTQSTNNKESIGFARQSMVFDKQNKGKMANISQNNNSAPTRK